MNTIDEVEEQITKVKAWNEQNREGRRTNKKDQDKE